MKLVFLAASLVAAFMVDCLSQPESDSQHSLVGHGQPQWPDFTLGPDDLEEIPSNGTEIPSNGTEHIPDWFDFEEEKGQSESELRGPGHSCKAKLPCSILGGSCVASGARCYGRRVPNGCKGSCDCCIPGCSEELGFFSPPGSNQCFKFFKDKYLNWTDANLQCKKEGLVPAHPYDPVTLRSYLVIRYGYYSPAWLYARGTGSYITWQDNGQRIRDHRYNPLWYPNQPSNNSTSFCLRLIAYDSAWNRYPTQPYYAYNCSYRQYTLCEYKYGRVIM